VYKTYRLFAILLLLIVNLSALSSSASNPASSPPSRWAVVVGITNFSNSSVPALPFAEKNAADFYALLVKGNEFSADHVKLLQNLSATKKNILDAITNWLPSVVKPDDVVILYINTHCPPKNEGADRSILIPSDGDKLQLRSTGIDIKELLAGLGTRLGTKKILCVLDTSHCDASDLAANGNFVMTSSGPKENSNNSRRYRNSIFTHSLLNELRRFMGSSSLESVFKNVSRQTEREAEQDCAASQHPQLAGGDANSVNFLLDTVPPDKP
jgi:hypothetical protein